jgi:hypothetical protein
MPPMSPGSKRLRRRASCSDYPPSVHAHCAEPRPTPKCTLTIIKISLW